MKNIVVSVIYIHVGINNHNVIGIFLTNYIVDYTLFIQNTLKERSEKY